MSPDPTTNPDQLREALADDLGETHDHELPIHDVWADVFLGQAEALIARGWTRAARALTPSEPTLDPKGLILYGLDVQEIKRAIDIADLYRPQWRVAARLGGSPNAD